MSIEAVELSRHLSHAAFCITFPDQNSLDQNFPDPDFPDRDCPDWDYCQADQPAPALKLAPAVQKPGRKSTEADQPGR